MGYITNSVGLRLGFSGIHRGWNDKIFANKLQSSDVVFFKKFLTEFVERVFIQRRFQLAGFMFSHLSLKTMLRGKLLVSTYLYDSEIDIMGIKLHRLITSNYGLRALKYKFKGRLYRILPYHERKIIEDYILQGRKYRILLGELNKSSYTTHVVRFLQRYVLKGRKILYKYLNSYLSSYASKILGVPVVFKFNLLPQRIPSVSLLGNYIIRKLYYKFRLNQILNPIIRRVSRRSLVGLRIDTSGRFTRAQRASHGRVQFGQVPLNNFALNIDYINKTIPLRYGVCSIKVWTCYKTFTPFVYERFSKRVKSYNAQVLDSLPGLNIMSDIKKALYAELDLKSEHIRKPYLLPYYHNPFYRSLLRPKKKDRKKYFSAFKELFNIRKKWFSKYIFSLPYRWRRNKRILQKISSRAFLRVKAYNLYHYKNRLRIEEIEEKVEGKPYYRRAFYQRRAYNKNYKFQSNRRHNNYSSRGYKNYDNKFNKGKGGSSDHKSNVWSTNYEVNNKNRLPYNKISANKDNKFGLKNVKK